MRSSRQARTIMKISETWTVSFSANEFRMTWSGFRMTSEGGLLNLQRLEVCYCVAASCGACSGTDCILRKSIATSCA